MDPSTSNDSEVPKPISSPRRTLPEAPPSYYDFPPSYTTNGDIYTDELPAYCPREFPSRPPCAQDQSSSQRPPLQRVYTVLPRQSYAIRMHRTYRTAPPRNQHLRRQLNKLFGLAFIIMLAIVILVLAVLMTVSLV